MPVTAWASPSTVTGSGWIASDGGTLVNALASGGDPSATNTTPVEGPLICTNFTWVTIPPGAQLDGIEVEIQGEFMDRAIVFGLEVPYCGVKITKDAVNPYGSEKEFGVSGAYDATGPYLTVTLGGPADLWGGALIDTDVGMSSFGFLLNIGSSDTCGAPVPGRAFPFFRARIWYTEISNPPPELLVACDDNVRYIPGLSVRGSAGSVRR